jgi:putative SOS response-associated peptidase YedK
MSLPQNASAPFWWNAASPSKQNWLASGSICPQAAGRNARLNARTDSLCRGSFKTMLANRRCVIPAEGFYEWREENGKKQPYFFYRKDAKPVMFAGIWDYSDGKGDVVP